MHTLTSSDHGQTVSELKANGCGELIQREETARTTAQTLTWCRQGQLPAFEQPWERHTAGACAQALPPWAPLGGTYVSP